MKVVSNIIFIGAVSLALASCASQDFAGDVAVRQPSTAPTNQTTTNNNTNGGPSNPTPTNPADPTNGPLSDDGTLNGLPGVPVAKVGIGFEDRTDNDFNDFYLCFDGNFNINGREIISNREQTIQASWGNIAAIGHKATITISDSTGKQIFQQNYGGTSKAKGTIALTFTKGSKLHVKITNPNVDHTHASRAQVHLDRCNNTGG